MKNLIIILFTVFSTPLFAQNECVTRRYSIDLCMELKTGDEPKVIEGRGNVFFNNDGTIVIGFGGTWTLFVRMTGSTTNSTNELVSAGSMKYIRVEGGKQDAFTIMLYEGTYGLSLLIVNIEQESGTNFALSKREKCLKKNPNSVNPNK